MGNEPVFPRQRVTIVGVVNVTPDSFSDGGRLVGSDGRVAVEAAIDAASAMADAGAHVLDVGGESTRPGAAEVPEGLEIDRTAPVVEALRARLPLPVSIDTRKAAVADAALEAGASIVNDVSGGTYDAGLASVAARHDATLIVNHIRGTPQTMQQAPRYDDVLAEVADERLAVDPGIGFGKRLEDNLELIAHVGWLRERLGRPLLIGLSRKSFLGHLTGDPVESRDLASHAAAAVAVFAGADAVRVHEVAGARRAVAVARALRDARRKELT